MYKVGLIGCGGIAPTHHSGFQATGRARIAYVYDIDSAAMQRRAADWGAVCMGSGQEVIESDADIIALATPGFARLDYLKAAAAAGKHILSEKPIALSLGEAEQMREAVASSSGAFHVHFTQRFNPPMVTLYRAQQAGRIGDVVSASARLLAPASSARWLDIVNSGHWRASKALSGGRINEFCSHTVNWLLWVLGRPRRVYGRALYVTEGFSLDDADVAIVECERGTGLLEVHRHAGVPGGAGYGIVGHGGSVMLSEGRIQLTKMDQKPTELPVVTDVETPHEHFLRCIETGAASVNDLEDAIDTLKVCLAFNRSAESGNVEAV